MMVQSITFDKLTNSELKVLIGLKRVKGEPWISAANNAALNAMYEEYFCEHQYVLALCPVQHHTFAEDDN